MRWQGLYLRAKNTFYKIVTGLLPCYLFGRNLALTTSSVSKKQSASPWSLLITDLKKIVICSKTVPQFKETDTRPYFCSMRPLRTRLAIESIWFASTSSNFHRFIDIASTCQPYFNIDRWRVCLLFSVWPPQSLYIYWSETNAYHLKDNLETTFRTSECFKKYLPLKQYFMWLWSSNELIGNRPSSHGRSPPPPP